LKKWLKALLDKYSQKPDYIYTCNQLKAIRQDLTVHRHPLSFPHVRVLRTNGHAHAVHVHLPLHQVQHIKNGFTIKVYEKHARLALQNVRLFLLARAVREVDSQLTVQRRNQTG
jgi:hypothetical protein